MFDWFDEFKASVEAGIKSGIESSVLGLAQSFMNGIEEFFKVPEPDGAFQLIRIIFIVLASKMLALLPTNN